MKPLSFDGLAVAAIVANVAHALQQFRHDGLVQLTGHSPEGPVTTADLHSQEMIISELVTQFGPAQFIAEEGPYRHAELRPDTSAWIIDPLDGTSGYLSGGQHYGVQVAALSEGRLVGAWIACPGLGWNIAAWEGSPLHVDVPTATDDLDGRVLIADGDFDTDHLSVLRTRGVTGYLRSSSCAVDYTLLATGRLDLAMYRRTHPWDHAPGAHLVSKAAGRSIRWDGSAYGPADGGHGIITVAAGIDPQERRRQLLP